MSNSDNLHYWILLREAAKKRVDHSVLFVVAIALVFDVILAIFVVVRVVFLNELYDVFNILSCYDIVVLTAHLLGLILVVVQINTKISLDTVTLLESIKLDQATLIVRLEQNLIQVKEAKKAAEVETSHKATRQYKTKSEIKDTQVNKKSAADLTPELKARTEMAPGTEQDYDDLIGVGKEQQSNDLQKREIELSDQIRLAQAHSQLVLSAISTMQVLDQPITILGLNINDEFVAKMAGLLFATAGPAVFSALSTLQKDFIANLNNSTTSS